MALESATTERGESVFVDRSDAERGSEAPFYAVYSRKDSSSRWGYVCSNCESFDNAMDTMGKIECNSCGNIRKPEEWDAAHE